MIRDRRLSDWLERDPDPETRRELERLADTGEREELERRFAGRLSFGTAGLRAVVGAGPMRMNRLVVRETTAGLGAYLLETIADARARGVIVGYDARRDSRVFAEDAAGVLAALGIHVALTDRPQPTPICSFAVKHHRAAAGVVITASHNPPDYNGYKVYWENGAQILPPLDAGIASKIEVAAGLPIPWMDLEQAANQGRLSLLGTEIEERYLAGVRSQSVHAPNPARAELAIAYTPLHGVGARVAEKALRQAGFERLHVVTSQREPDPDFPTVRFPNPEEPGSMDAVLALAREVAADLAFANDPDADRLAVAVRAPDGSHRVLTGDEVGVLLGTDIIEAVTEPITVATTIVSSRLLGVIAAEKGVDYIETLTGFKWIVNQALARRKEGYRFAFGYEEALGYTVGELVPDKDGLSAMVAFAEMAAECRRKGITVLDELEAIYRTYGLYLTAQSSLTLDPNQEGPTLTSKLRALPPSRLAGRAVHACLDVQAGQKLFADGGRQSCTLPPSDVLVYELEGGARVVVRPSGTEPKIKCYYEIREDVAAGESMEEAEDRARAELRRLTEDHQKDLSALL